MTNQIATMENIEDWELDALAEKTDANMEAQDCEVLRGLLREERLKRVRERRDHKREMNAVAAIVSCTGLSLSAMMLALLLPPWTACLPVIAMALVMHKLR